MGANNSRKTLGTEKFQAIGGICKLQTDKLYKIVKFDIPLNCEILLYLTLKICTVHLYPSY